MQTTGPGSNGLVWEVHDAMAIQYAFHEEGQTLVVTASGFDESLDEVMEYGRSVLEACQRLGVRCLLCLEQNLEYRLSTTDTYTAAEALAKHAPQIGKAALVVNAGYAEDVQFWENVVVNRGLTVRVFCDEADARHWLDGDT